MTVITISRQFGSGGDEIAQQLCQTLGYQLFNKQMVMEAAREAGLSEQEIIDYTEENHKVRGFLNRLFENTPILPYTGIWPDDLTAVLNIEEMHTREANSLRFIQKTILSAYQKGRILIIGRGGQVVLQDKVDVVHVRVIAPLEMRIERIKERFRVGVTDLTTETDQHLAAQARDLIHRRDEASADYIKRLYLADWTDPLLYHLVVNTGKISITQAVAQISGLVSLYANETNDREPAARS